MAGISPVTPQEIQDTIPESTGSICTKLNALWSLANKMFEFFDWLENADGSLSDDAKDFFAEVSVPPGSIVLWPMDTAPLGWITANGAIVSRTTYANIFNAYGTKYGEGDGSTTFQLPDLQRKFILGTSGTNVSGSEGGNESVALKMVNLPAEPAPLGIGVDRLLIVKNTAVADDTSPDLGAIATANIRARSNTHIDHDENVLADLGTSEPFSIIPTYFSGMWIIKV